MENNTPLISVIVPVYNIKEFLKDCVNSIINQTYNNLEIILVDDGSTDGSGELCDSYLDIDGRIKVIHQSNGGLSAARNTGINNSTGDYLGFIDSDDWIDKKFYEVLLNAIKDNHADIAACEAYFIYKREQVSSNADNVKGTVYNTEDAINYLIDNSVFSTTVWNRLYKKSTIDKVYFKTGIINEDVLWSYNAFKNADKVVHIPEKLYYYYQRQNSIMNSSYSKKRFDGLDSIKEQMKLIQNDFPALYIKAFDIYIGSCLYHYQTICRQKEVDPNHSLRNEIKQRIHEENIKFLKKQKRKLKHQIWFNMFMTCPDFTSFIRNKLKIGL